MYPQICEAVNHRLHSIGLPEDIIIAIEEYDLNESSICESANHKFELAPEMLINYR